MPPDQPIQLHPDLTTWHITWGTYGTRLHGGRASTVTRKRNQRGQPFFEHDPDHHESMREILKYAPVRLTESQRGLIEQALPAICARGGWRFRIVAAQPDHVHVLLDVKPEIHGKQVRPWLKRWVSEALNREWPAGSERSGSLDRGGVWWAEGGSTIAVRDLSYLRNVTHYIARQQHT